MTRADALDGENEKDEDVADASTPRGKAQV